MPTSTCTSPILATPPQRLQTSNYWTPSCHPRNRQSNQRPQHPCPSISHLSRPRHLGQPLSRYHHVCLLLRLTPLPGPSLPDPPVSDLQSMDRRRRAPNILTSISYSVCLKDDARQDLTSGTLLAPPCCCARCCLAIALRLQG